MLSFSLGVSLLPVIRPLVPIKPINEDPSLKPTFAYTYDMANGHNHRAAIPNSFVFLPYSPWPAPRVRVAL